MPLMNFDVWGHTDYIDYHYVCAVHPYRSPRSRSKQTKKETPLSWRKPGVLFRISLFPDYKKFSEQVDAKAGCSVRRLITEYGVSR